MAVTEVLLSPTFLTVLFFALLIGFFAGLIFFHIFDSRVFDERGRLIPGPKHHLWGKNNYFSILRLASITHQYSKTIYEKFLKEAGNGDIVAYNWINGKATIIIAHPDMVKNVLSGHHLKFLKDDSWDRVRDLLGNGLGTCPAKTWQRYRNILSPLFRSSNLRDMVTTFNIHSRRLLRHWHFRLQQAIQDAPDLAANPTPSNINSNTTSSSTTSNSAALATAPSATASASTMTINTLDRQHSTSVNEKIYIKSIIDKELRHLILGIICEAGFGYDFFTKKNSELFAQDFEILFNEFSHRMSSATTTATTSSLGGGSKVAGDPLSKLFGKASLNLFLPTGSSSGSSSTTSTKQDPQIVKKALLHIQQLIEKTIDSRLNGTPLDDDVTSAASSSAKSSPAPSPPPPPPTAEDLQSLNTTQVPPLPPPAPSSSTSHNPLPRFSPQNSVSDFGSPPNDLLQLLLYANEDTIDYQKLSIEEIRDHIISFMILGFENTAMTLIWMIYELCLHPKIQRQCQQEIDMILTIKGGIKTSAVTYEDIPKFHKLIQVLKETLRLHPPMATISRKCTTSCNIGDYSVKAGSRISISVLALHQHSDYWYLPNDFFPDRFAQENIVETIKHPFQYIPFGAGGRNCIGQRFAQMGIVVIMAILLSKYHFTLDEDDKKKIIFEEKASFGPSNLRVVIQDRERSFLTPPNSSTSSAAAGRSHNNHNPSSYPPVKGTNSAYFSSHNGSKLPPTSTGTTGGNVNGNGNGAVSGTNSRSSSVSSNPGSVGSNGSNQKGEGNGAGVRTPLRVNFKD